MKGTPWLLLKHTANLDKTRNERQRLDASPATAYQWKEDLRQVCEQPDRRIGELVLERWIRTAEVSGIRQLIKFAGILCKHLQGFLAWYDDPIGTGPLEGANNKIQLLQRQTFGYCDNTFFKLRLHGLHRGQQALFG